MIAGYDVTRVLYILTIPGRMSLCVPMNNYIGRLLSSLPGRGEVRDMDGRENITLSCSQIVKYCSLLINCGS